MIVRPSPRRPIVGVMCCNEVAGRPIQAVASRFLTPLAQVSGAAPIMIPALPDAVDIATLTAMLDGLLLTGSRSHVSPDRYGEASDDGHVHDPARDEVALALGGAMIEAGKPVFGICRGMQEINVLFGGTLSHEACDGRHKRGSWEAYHDLFTLNHEVALAPEGRLGSAAGVDRIIVNSVHEQGIARLGGGLTVEAIAVDDGLVEAIAARPNGADVLAVQWHPEWDLATPGGHSFFRLFGASLRGGDTDFPTKDER